MEEVVLNSSKMSCGHCKMAVENAAGALAGVSSVSADPESKRIEVTYDENMVSLDAIKKAIAEAGYPAE
ncbi:MAG: heavy-metal-associated domain-containing protein [Thermoleophilia bacterium]|nr:heavy-metal-associated domain-containing protein [Thermoleophilia bacterium]